jgi:hypothetical protein
MHLTPQDQLPRDRIAASSQKNSLLGGIAITDREQFMQIPSSCQERLSQQGIGIRISKFEFAD